MSGFVVYKCSHFQNMTVCLAGLLPWTNGFGFHCVPVPTVTVSLDWSLGRQDCLWTMVQLGQRSVQSGPTPAGLMLVVEMGVAPHRSFSRRGWWQDSRQDQCCVHIGLGLCLACSLGHCQCFCHCVWACLLKATLFSLGLNQGCTTSCLAPKAPIQVLCLWDSC